MVTKTKYTYEDYLNMPEGERYELLDGELILVASPNMAHQGNQARLGSRMFIFSEDNDLGRVFFSSTDVVLSDDSGTDVVQPDILFISKEREDIITDANVQGAPDLVVEILSPSTSRRDWKYKRELYARYGVKEYWIIDPANRIVTVMLLKEGVLEIGGAFVEGDTLVSAALEGFEVGVERDILGESRGDGISKGHG